MQIPPGELLTGCTLVDCWLTKTCHTESPNPCLSFTRIRLFPYGDSFAQSCSVISSSLVLVLLNYSALLLQYATASLLDVQALMLENKTFGTALEMSGLLVSCTPLTESTNESVQKRNISPSTQQGAFYLNFI
jgi:hypothetical protein